MSKYQINGYECDFPAVPFDLLKAYEPSSRTYIIAGRPLEPVGRLFMAAMIDEGIRVGALARVQQVENGERFVYLAAFCSQEWKDHFEFFLRIECGPDRWMVMCPYRVWLEDCISMTREESKMYLWRIENYIHSLGVEPYNEWIRGGRTMEDARRIVTEFRAKCSKEGVKCGR